MAHDRVDGLDRDVELKEVLHGHLRKERAALLAKLDGISETDARLPRTPTGTNLLGLVKHCASVEAGYFAEVFARPSNIPLPWEAAGVSEEDNLDFFAADDETMEDVLAFCQRCFDHADQVIDELDLHAPGRVPWWPEGRNPVTLGQIISHVALDEAQHAGHADILREQLDGTAGLRSPGNNLPDWPAHRWAEYVKELKRIAEARRH